MSNGSPAVEPGYYDDGHGRRRWWDGTQWTDQYEQPASSSAPKKTGPARILSPIFVGVAALILGIILGSSFGGGGSRDLRAENRELKDQVADLRADNSDLREQLDGSAAEEPPAEEEPEQPAAPAEVTTFGAGLYVVGTSPVPGTYSTTGPDGSNGAGCYYAWKSGTGSDADIVDNNIIQGSGVVTLAAGEVFETQGCADWVKTG